MKDAVKMIEDAKEKGIPTFTIKATDAHAEGALTTYLNSINSDPNVSREFVMEVSKIWQEFVQFSIQNKDKVKSPD